MFKNFFKTAWRNLFRAKSFTVINISGLALGMAVCMVIFIVIQFHKSFDQFHSKKDRIYRVLTEYHHADAPDVFYGKGVPYPMPAGLEKNFPHLEAVAPLYADHDDQLLVIDKNGNTIKKFKEQSGVFFTTPALFKIFDYPLLQGSYASLKDPNNVLLSKETANKYFGDWQNAIGKTLRLKTAYSDDVLKVSGILASIPANTDLQLKLVVSFGTGFTGSYVAKSTDWDGTAGDYGCFVLLPPNTSAGNFNRQLRAFSKKMESPENKDSHIIQQLGDIHFDTKTGNFSNQSISHELVNALWLIAAFIILIACINFINLSTSQAVRRAKEIGVRKVLGSSRRQVKVQFLAETFLVVIAAFFVSIAISLLALPYIGKILELPLSASLAFTPLMAAFLVCIIASVTGLAGFYPSVILSRFNPIQALKSTFEKSKMRGFSLRRALVVFQFIIAQALIIGTFIIVQQMNYFVNQPLGFDKAAILNVPIPGDSIGTSKIDYLRNQLSDIKGVQMLSFASNTPVEDDNDNWSNIRFDNAVKETDFYAITKFADDQYVPAYNLQFAAGRNMQPSDTAREFLVNEELVKSLGIKDPEKVLNKPVSIWGDQLRGRIVGVLKNFNDRSFRRETAPVLITTSKKSYSEAALKLSMTNTSSTIESVQKVWSKAYPDFVFEYKFLDDKIESFYKQESALSHLYKIFAGIAIFLSCLGLYGLASFMAAQRIKEVGIRKVLGASPGSIVYLFSREFVILIVIALAIASPIAWYYMHQWLQDYVFRIEIRSWVFLLGGAASVLIALATVSFQAIKAALANPVKSLRTE